MVNFRTKLGTIRAIAKNIGIRQRHYRVAGRTGTRTDNDLTPRKKMAHFNTKHGIVHAATKEERGMSLGAKVTRTSTRNDKSEDNRLIDLPTAHSLRSER